MAFITNYKPASGSAGADRKEQRVWAECHRGGEPSDWGCEKPSPADLRLVKGILKLPLQ